MGIIYEEIRQKRVEENRKRLRVLNLVKLSFSLRNLPSKSSLINKSSRNRALNKIIMLDKIRMIDVRRSPRVAANPAPVYFRSKSKMDSPSKCNKNYGRAVYSSFSDTTEEKRAYTIKEAEKLELKLKEEGFPTAIRPIVPSNINHSFSVGLPQYFCSSNLPHNDGMTTRVTLADEEGEEFPVAYTPGRNLLGSGWKQFALAHELVDGDAVIFQVIKPSVLKVHIIRSSDL